MPRRVSESVRAVEWFRSAPLEVAEEILAIVQQELKARRPKVSRVAKKGPVPPMRKARTNSPPAVIVDGQRIPGDQLQVKRDASD